MIYSFPISFLVCINFTYTKFTIFFLNLSDDYFDTFSTDPPFRSSFLYKIGTLKLSHKGNMTHKNTQSCFPKLGEILYPMKSAHLTTWQNVHQNYQTIAAEIKCQKVDTSFTLTCQSHSIECN